VGIYYSLSSRGFYNFAIHGDNMPGDVVEITAEEHATLLAGQTAGKVIAADENGRPVLQDPPPPTAEQTIEAMRAAIQAHMDAAANGYGYDDVKAAVTYAEEPAVPKFQAEGRAFRAWRSLVWGYAYDVLDKVQAGQRPQPTADQIISELPALEVNYGD
jgi:hypothetical protein